MRAPACVTRIFVMNCRVYRMFRLPPSSTIGGSLATSSLLVPRSLRLQGLPQDFANLRSDIPPVSVIEHGIRSGWSRRLNRISKRYSLMREPVL
jgi:hypothetical protein